MARELASALLAVVIVALSVTSAHAEYTSEDTFAALDEVSSEFDFSYHYLYNIVRCETGGTFDPYSIGRQGEQGVAQLHPRGELQTFYRWGYLDPFSPYQAVRFLAQRIMQGAARAWTCAY
jgi:hypothetical protein